MKVTVIFDSTRVVVPCGIGDFTVKHLVNLALKRFHKVEANQGGGGVEGRRSGPPRIRVLSLKHVDGGGILDVDDLVGDVVEDKDQLVAAFERLADDNVGNDDPATAFDDQFEEEEEDAETRRLLLQQHHKGDGQTDSSEEEVEEEDGNDR